MLPSWGSLCQQNTTITPLFWVRNRRATPVVIIITLDTRVPIHRYTCGHISQERLGYACENTHMKLLMLGTMHVPKGRIWISWLKNFGISSHEAARWDLSSYHWHGRMCLLGWGDQMTTSTSACCCCISCGLTSLRLQNSLRHVPDNIREHLLYRKVQLTHVWHQGQKL